MKYCTTGSVVIFRVFVIATLVGIGLVFGIRLIIVARFYRLTMSSSSTDTQLSAYKLKPPTYHANELQEVTSCTKETVRITPPPHDGVALRPTVLTVENHTPNGYVPS